MTRINIIILVKVVNKTFKIYDVFSFSLKKKKTPSLTPETFISTGSHGLTAFTDKNYMFFIAQKIYRINKTEKLDHVYKVFSDIFIKRVRLIR